MLDTIRLSRDQMNALFSAAVSGENALLFGAPGWGKTRAALTFLNRVFGEDAVGFLAFSPATPPEKAEGSIDIPRYLNDGVIEITRKGTPHDPAYSAWVFDEVGRGNEAILDALLPVLEAHFGHAPLVIATTNFMPKGKRFEALQTRFGLWVEWSPTAGVDELLAVAASVIRNDDHWGVEVYDEEIEAIAHARTATPTADIERLRPLVQAALEQQFPLTPRWMRVITRVYTRGALFYEALEGIAMHQAEAKAFRWLVNAVPTLDPELRAKWRDLVIEMVAPQDAAMERVLRDWRAAVAEFANAPAEARQSAFQRLREVYNNTRDTLDELEAQYGLDTAEIRRGIVAEFLKIAGEMK